MCLVIQSCPILCDPKDYSPPGSSDHGVFQARTLEWVAISFSRVFFWPRDWTQVSCIVGGFFTICPLCGYIYTSILPVCKWNLLKSKKTLFKSYAITSNNNHNALYCSLCFHIHLVWVLQNCAGGTSLLVQWLRLHAHNTGGPGFDPWSGN